MPVSSEPAPRPPVPTWRLSGDRLAARRAAGAALRRGTAAVVAAVLLAPLAAAPAVAEGGGQKRSAQLNAAFGLGFQAEPARPAPERPPAAPVQVIMAKPGTAAWNEACAARYHSFDPATGTYLGFDGKRYRCR
jgi:hypothetical protein